MKVLTRQEKHGDRAVDIEKQYSFNFTFQLLCYKIVTYERNIQKYS